MPLPTVSLWSAQYVSEVLQTAKKPFRVPSEALVGRRMRYEHEYDERRAC